MNDAEWEAAWREFWAADETEDRGAASLIRLTLRLSA
jgi:hypothetical protein